MNGRQIIVRGMLVSVGKRKTSLGWNLKFESHWFEVDNTININAEVLRNWRMMIMTTTPLALY